MSDVLSENAYQIPVIFPNNADFPSNVRAFCTTREGGVSRGVYGDALGQNGLNLGTHVGDELVDVQINRQRVNACLSSSVKWLSQVHGTRVVDISDAIDGADADACYAVKTGMACAVLTADCLPVLFADRKGTMVAAAHAGWRGLAGGVLENTISMLQAQGAEDIVAWMGPAIGARKFEVGAEVRAIFVEKFALAARFFQPNVVQQGKYFADIYGLAREIMNAVGCVQISGGEYCTVTQEAQFYSYRRDGQTGRMASLIWLAP